MVTCAFTELLMALGTRASEPTSVGWLGFVLTASKPSVHAEIITVSNSITPNFWMFFIILFFGLCIRENRFNVLSIFMSYLYQF